MNATHADEAALAEARSERPTMIEGLRPRQPQLRRTHAHELSARCLSCGAPTSDWRQLLGIGARLADCAADESRVVLEYPCACATCGSSEVMVSAA